MSAAQQELQETREQQRHAAEDAETSLQSTQMLETALADAVNKMNDVAAELERQRRETQNLKAANDKMKMQHDHAIQTEKSRICDLLSRLDEAEATEEETARAHKENLSSLRFKQKQDGAREKMLMWAKQFNHY